MQHLRGMFAFAIWDDRKEQLFIARDRLGIKPLYFAVNELGVSFASEIKALLAAGFVNPEPNWQALAIYLRLGAVPAPHTAIAGVQCLPPASWMVVRDGSVTIERYWDLVFGGGEDDQRRAIQRTRELLEESISLHLISDAPLGIFLSGGLDSNTIAALASAASSTKLRTLSVVFPEVRYSEASVARSAAKTFGTEHLEMEVTAGHVSAAIDGFIAALDQPTVDGMNSYFVCEVAKRAGLKVALSGLGGDEVFGGYPSFQAVPLLKSGIRAARSLPGHHWLADQASLLPVGNLTHRVIDAVRSPLPPWAGAYLAVRQVFPESLVCSYFRETVGAGLVSESGGSLGGYVESWNSAGSSFDRVSAFELQGYMANQLLRDTDVFSMAHSVEVRVPLLDHRLVEYVASLPEVVKRGKGKRLLRLAVGSLLPEEILARPKQGFAFPWNPWLLGQLGDELEIRMQAAYPLVSDLLRVDEVEALWSRFRNGSVPWAQVWSVAILVLWLARLRSGRHLQKVS